jgi:hypothetical protein
MKMFGGISKLGRSGEMRLLRVFPRKTRATPVDDFVRIGLPTMFDEADEIHISVTFTWDMPEAERLERQWRHIAPTLVGGPATGEPSQEFIPGCYIKNGYVITSRGCPNSCWFCEVPKREGRVVRELPITEGWNVLDDNLLACSRDHIEAVFAMLAKQKKRPQFTGGLEAKRLKSWHLEAMRALRVDQFFFAYDTPDDWEWLERAASMLVAHGFSRQQARCYVLIGYPDDTLLYAESRLWETLDLGIFPMAMLWRDKTGTPNKDWKTLQREWARPAIIYSKTREAQYG